MGWDEALLRFWVWRVEVGKGKVEGFLFELVLCLCFSEVAVQK